MKEGEDRIMLGGCRKRCMVSNEGDGSNPNRRRNILYDAYLETCNSVVKSKTGQQRKHKRILSFSN